MKIGKLLSAKVMALITGPLAIIATILGLVNDVPGAVGLFSNHSGNVSLTYKGEAVDNIGERHVVVCLDDATSVSKLTNIFPTFSNNTSYSVSNFAVRYSLEPQGITFSPTDFYSMAPDGEADFVMKYKDNTLPAFTTVERPIRSFHLNDNGGKLKLSAKASYDGIANPITYDVYANFYVIPYTASISYEEWKRACQRKFLTETRNLRECDIYYLSQKKGLEQDINVNLGILAQNSADPEKQVSTQDKPRSKASSENPATKVSTPTKASYTTPLPETPSPIVASLLPNVRIERITEGNEVYLECSPSCISDTTLMMLVLLEDSVTNKKSNILWAIDAKSQYNQTNMYQLSNPNIQLLDYNFCKKISGLGDSISLNNDSILENNTARTIAFYAENKNGYSTSSILKPKDKKDLRNSFGYVFTDYSYYDLPEELLADENKQKADENKQKDVLQINDQIYDSLLLSGMLCFIIVISILFRTLLFLILSVFAKELKKFSDIPKCIIELWDNIFNAKNIAQLLWKQFLFLILAFIGIAAVIYIIFLLT